MQEQDQEIIREFLVESHENLSRLDQELVELENRPKDAALLGGVFRTIHTIKGTCGFLGFSTLERITHQAETLLSQLRDGQRELNPALVSLILETVDATRNVLASIEASGQEGPEQFVDLAERLRASAQSPKGEASTPPQPPAKAAAPQPKPEQDPAKNSSVADANIRVAVGLLDKLMDLVGELVLTRNQILQFNTEREDACAQRHFAAAEPDHLELQEGVMKTRMQPIGMVWNKLPRVVRDMAVALGKQIRLETEGAETELDRTIIEAIQRSAGSPGPQLLRPRHRAGGGARPRRQSSAGDAVAARLSRRRAGEHRDRRRRRGHRRRASETEGPREGAAVAGAGRRS